MTQRKHTDTESAAFRARAEHRRATWSIKRHTSFEQMKIDEYTYWATQAAHVIVAAVSEMTADAYAMKGINVSRLSRPYRSPE